MKLSAMQMLCYVSVATSVERLKSAYDCETAP